MLDDVLKESRLALELGILSDGAIVDEIDVEQLVMQKLKEEKEKKVASSKRNRMAASDANGDGEDDDDDDDGYIPIDLMDWTSMRRS